MKHTLFALTISLLCAAPAYADDNFAGARIEAHLGYERPNLNRSSGNSNIVYVETLSSSAIYGGEVGYDFPVSSRVTVGPYAAYDLSSAKKCEYGYTGGYYATVCYSDSGDLSVGARAALRGEHWRGYVGLGYDSYATKLSATVSSGVASASAAYGTKRGGVGITFGADYKLSRHTYAGLAMRVSEFGEFEGTGYNLQRVQVHALLGTQF